MDSRNDSISQETVKSDTIVLSNIDDILILGWNCRKLHKEDIFLIPNCIPNIEITWGFIGYRKQWLIGMGPVLPPLIFQRKINILERISSLLYTWWRVRSINCHNGSRPQVSITQSHDVSRVTVKLALRWASTKHIAA